LKRNNIEKKTRFYNQPKDVTAGCIYSWLKYC